MLDPREVSEFREDFGDRLLNLYLGSYRNTPYKWLDLAKLFAIIFPTNQIGKKKYFTARVRARPGDPGQPMRQETYLRALETIPNPEIHFGHFLASPV